MKQTTIILIETLVLLLLLAAVVVYGQVVLQHYHDSLSTNQGKSIVTQDPETVEATDEESNDRSEPLTKEEYERAFAELKALSDSLSSSTEQTSESGTTTDTAADMRTTEEEARIQAMFDNLDSVSNRGGVTNESESNTSAEGLEVR